LVYNLLEVSLDASETSSTAAWISFHPRLPGSLEILSILLLNFGAPPVLRDCGSRKLRVSDNSGPLSFERLDDAGVTKSKELLHLGTADELQKHFRDADLIVPKLRYDSIYEAPV
jgi:hypothetical protein